MNTNTNIKERELVRGNVSIGAETSKAALGIGLGLAALVGLWGVACLVGGLATSGIAGVVTGYVRAVTGM